MSIENTNKQQSDLINKLFGVDKGKVAIEKKSFRNNLRLCLSAREKFLIFFKARYFQKQMIDLYKTNQAEIEQIVNQAIYVMTDLRKAAVR